MVEVRNRIKADNGFVSFHDIFKNFWELFEPGFYHADF